MMKKQKRTRRQFLQSLPVFSAGFWATAKAGPESAQASSALSARVVVASRGSVLPSSGAPDVAQIRKLLDESILALTGQSDKTQAWRRIISPGDVVGIKVNCLAGRGLSTHPELVSAIVDCIGSAGLPREKIMVWDRTERDLISAGFSLNGLNGARVLATDSPGVGYESTIEFSGEVGSCFSKIISRMCTAIINVPVLKDHDLAGVSLGMKNFYGAIHNPNKYHDNNCNPFVADLSAHPFIKNKLRLVVCDGLTAQYHGGPAPRPQWTWPAATLLLATDPVAVDRIGWDIIERKRKEKNLQSLAEVGRYPNYIETAEKCGLGIADVEKISKVVIS